MESDTARVIIEVSAGVIPGRAERRAHFNIASRAWYGSEDPFALLASLVDDALNQARAWMNAPDEHNWVRVDWVWP